MTTPRRHCVACGAVLHGRFCAECGAAVGAVPVAPAAPRGNPWPYLLVAVMLLGLVVTIVMTRNRGGAGGPAAATPSGAQAPVAGATGLAAQPAAASTDLSTMTPVEQFDQLFDRVMRASETGDTATVATFAPRALAAFTALPAPDIDARFHAGLIQLASGDVTAAAAQATAIGKAQPAHLFGLLLKGKIAERSQDAAGLAAARRDFLAAFPAENAAQRPEYPGHQAMIDRFLSDATAAAR